MTDTHTLTGLPSSVRDLTLNLTGLAQTVVLAASIPTPGEDYEGPITAALFRDCYVEAWETLTGLTGDAAVEVAQAISRHPLPVTAAVVPL